MKKITNKPAKEDASASEKGSSQHRSNHGTWLTRHDDEPDQQDIEYDYDEHEGCYVPKDNPTDDTVEPDDDDYARRRKA